jgi:hypothetical protein
LEDEFLEKFWSFIPNSVEKRTETAEEISRKILQAVPRDLPLISLDRVYLPYAENYLEVTRRTNPQTGEVTIAERFGSCPIEEQIKRIKQYPRVNIADVGAFEGDTILSICQKLAEKDIAVERVYLGFSDNRAKKKIGEKAVILEAFDFYEWIELRDLFGIDGRLVGTLNGKRAYMPYWENLPKWASIQQEYELECAKLCKKYYRKVINLLKSNNLDINNIGIPIRYQGGTK